MTSNIAERLPHPVDSQKQYWSFKRDYKDVVLFFKIGVRGYNLTFATYFGWKHLQSDWPLLDQRRDRGLH